MSTLDEFIEQTEQALQLPAGSLPPQLRDQLLDLTREVAHGVTRIAGPLSTYLLGVAVGAGADSAAGIAAVAAIARDRQPEDQGHRDSAEGTAEGAS